MHNLFENMQTLVGKDIMIATPSFIDLITGLTPSCPEGNVTVVSDVNNSSLQLVEMCSIEGLWSPVCDNNWTLQDATVVCREIGQGKGLRWYIYVNFVSLCLTVFHWL